MKSVVCIKASTQTAFYENSPDLMAGCVLYEAGQLKCGLPDRTIIPPDNAHAVFYKTIIEDASKGVFHFLGVMPSDFHSRLQTAIKNSVRLSPKRKSIMLKMIE